VTSEQNVTPAYLAERYPDPVLRASMAREADEIGAKARGLGNDHGAGQWHGLARDFRDSLTKGNVRV
jgi:hypothetical protein